MTVLESEPPAESTDVRPGAVRVLVISTIGFTLMFAVWLMFGVLGIPIREEFGLTDVQLSWIIAVAVLNGAIWRLPAGIITDRRGGRLIMTLMLAATAVPAFLVSTATSYAQLLVYAFLVGLAGNAFSVGIAWVSVWWPRGHQGFALGVFGAGNVGASVTKFIGPALIAAVPAAGYLGGLIPGGWRFVPFLYMVLLLIMAAVTWFMTPRHDLVPGQGRPLKAMLAPLQQMRVWRFSLYYVVVFGAYVALAAWLPKYYVDVYDIDLTHAALLTALFIFPASLLRPVGGWVSDKVGARRVMYATFGTMLVTTGILMMPYGYIVINTADGGTNEILPWQVGPALFTRPGLHHRVRHGNRQGRGLQTHPRVLPARRRCRGRARRLDRGAGRVLPATDVRVRDQVDRSPASHLRRALPGDADRRRMDAPDGGTDAAPRQPRPGQQVRARARLGEPE